jgi:sulfide:quinone oxidoreductase
MRPANELLKTSKKMHSKTVLVLGAGIGGIVCASTLRRDLDKVHRVVLVGPELVHSFPASYVWVIVGDRSRQEISRPLDLKEHGIDFIQGKVDKVDPQRKRVTLCDGHELVGDYIVIALGAELAPELIPGLKEGGHNLYSLDGAEAIREARLHLHGGRVAILVAGMPFKCPAAPCEAAMILENDFVQREIRYNVQLDFYTPEPGPMTVAGEKLSNQVRQVMESKGIHYHANHSVVSVNEKLKQITFQTGIVADFDLLLYVPPHRVPAGVVAGGLAKEGGWIPVDRSTLATSFPGVFAIGDVNVIPLKVGKPLPKAGVFARAQAEVVARNIIREINGGKGEAATFDGQGKCFLETGGDQAGVGAGNFFAEPLPHVELQGPSREYHEAKVEYEQAWLSEWFANK